MLRAAHIPNLISVLRMLLVVPIVAALLADRVALALVLVAFAGLSDGLDGFLAKRCGWQSRLGGLLDPLADKLLLVSLFVTLAVLALLPVWLAAVVVGRDLIIVSGGVAYNSLIGPVQPEPSGASKLNTLAQLLCIASVLFEHASGWRLGPWVTLTGAMTLVTAVVSGLDYVLRWSRKALAARA